MEYYQLVRLQHCVSEHLICNIEALEGTVLSPFLFTIYTSDFHYSTELCHLQKFSDDVATVRCVENGWEDEYRNLVNLFFAWWNEEEQATTLFCMH